MPLSFREMREMGLNRDPRDWRLEEEVGRQWTLQSINYVTVATVAEPIFHIPC